MLYTHENTVLAGKPADVYLDDVLIEDVISADDTEGWVEILKQGNDGNYIVNESGDEFIREKKYGSVRVVFSS